jgi:hypothetical protein
MSLAALAQGFRSAYLDHAAIVRQLEAWHAAYPEFTRLTSIGKTPEGRDLWVLTVGADPDRARPTAWVDGNMHASELAGSSVALAIAEDFLAAHVEPERLGLPAPVLERLRATRLFVLAADVARRRRVRCSPPAATCARCRATIAARSARASGAATISTATVARWRCASPIRPATTSRRPIIPT